MPVFPILELEELVQEKDKVRLDASKSFVSVASAITEIKIKPANSVTAVSVFGSGDPTRWYLDYLYDFEIDVDTSENNKIDFKEGATSYVATIPEGLYSLEDLADEIADQMSSEGGQVYTAEVSDNTFTISAPGEFSLLISSGSNADFSLFGSIGFTGADLSAAATYTGAEIKYVNADVSVELTSGTGMSAVVETITKRIEIISEEADHLFSDDQQLKQHELNITKYVPSGKSSFKYIHREAQRLILAWLDMQGYVDNNRRKFTKEAIVDISEVREWSMFMTLKLIFEGVSNEVDDIFHEKAKRYLELEEHYRNRAILRLDTDGDGDADIGEDADVRTIFVARR